MSVSIVIDALKLPADSRVDQRIPKKLLLENGAPTSADKKQIQDGIEELLWVAALKPMNIGVQSFRDDLREYLEIAVLALSLRVGAKADRLIELVHRAVPYPLLLVTTQAGTASVSLAHKRWSQGEANKVVIEGLHQTSSFQPDAPTASETAFLSSLALTCLPSNDLYSLYEGWIGRVAAIEAAQITGSFTPPESAERAAAMQQALEAHSVLTREIDGLRTLAAKEKQISRRVAVNLEIKRLEARLTETTKMLSKHAQEQRGS